VYELITKCFYDKKKYPEYALLKSFRKRLYKNKSVINVQDFGAGSKIFKNNERQISKVAKTAGITAKRAELLFRLTQYFQSKSILELGTSVGMATSALSLGNPKANIITIEGCKETAKVAEEQFNHFKLKNTQPINSEFDVTLNASEIKNSKFDLIYLDGNHNKEATLKYFNTLLSNINNESVMVFDDIHWSKGMTEAWEIIKQNPKVKVTIDTFYWGLVFFRKEQRKEHFSIRV
jgi:predicted O-methyltransferase YrrM